MTKKEFVSMSLPYGLKVLIPEYDTKVQRNFTKQPYKN